jgi:ABC-type nickel/cobalt efflux system permease component RcnA
VATLAAGIGVARTVGETLEESAAVLLVVFGLVYAAWAWRKGGHFHPGGRLLHSRDEGPACGGSEGVSPEHLHYHADEKLIRGSRHRGPVALAVIVGINPCILILPIVFGTAQHGAGAVAAVLAAYSATTVALMVGLSVMGVLGTRRLRLPAGARYMETASGLVIAVTGVLFWLLGHS